LIRDASWVMVSSLKWPFHIYCPFSFSKDSWIVIGFGLDCQSILKIGFGFGLSIKYLCLIWIGLTIKKLDWAIAWLRIIVSRYKTYINFVLKLSLKFEETYFSKLETELNWTEFIYTISIIWVNLLLTSTKSVL